MKPLRTLFALAVPASIALAAFLNAQGVSALVGATMGGPVPLPGVAEAQAATPGTDGRRRAAADSILDHNPFDHLTSRLRGSSDLVDEVAKNTDPRTAPLCEGVRPLVVVGDENQDVAFASLEYGGQRLLRRRGGEVGPSRVAYVGRDRVWLEGSNGLCQAPLFGAPAPKPEGAVGTRAAAEP
jgi:hypothetical protein